jgi:hypothetical protein
MSRLPSSALPRKAQINGLKLSPNAGAAAGSTGCDDVAVALLRSLGRRTQKLADALP